MQAARMNAVWLQVRPMSDALYNSAYEQVEVFDGNTWGRVRDMIRLAFAMRGGA